MLIVTERERIAFCPVFTHAGAATFWLDPRTVGGFFSLLTTR